MNILYLLFHGLSPSSGISKKIIYQMKGMKELGHNVKICTYSTDERGHKVRMIDNSIIANYGTGYRASIKNKIEYASIIQYVANHNIDFVYVRSFHNATPFTINLFKSLRQKGIKIAMEIPTYPYDQEYAGFPLMTRIGIQIDKLFRYRLARQTDAIVTFSKENEIFGQRTIRISNGIDFDSVPLKRQPRHIGNEIHLIGVAEVHYWHGYDRLIAGLGAYYRQAHDKEVFFHIVGGIGPSEMYDSQHAPGFHELIEKYSIQKQVVFHGQMFGDELNDLFNNADFAIGSLARHRSGITHIKTLKNREYAARGIPFIYSETDEDFDNMPYILKAPADETPINIEQLINFYEKEAWDAAKIRASISHLSWKEQMNKVIESISLIKS